MRSLLPFREVYGVIDQTAAQSRERVKAMLQKAPVDIREQRQRDQRIERERFAVRMLRTVRVRMKQLRYEASK